MEHIAMIIKELSQNYKTGYHLINILLVMLGIYLLCNYDSKNFIVNALALKFKYISILVLIIGILLIILGLGLSLLELFSKNNARKRVLITHEILRPINFNEIKKNLPEFNFKLFKLDFRSSYKDGQLIEPKSVYTKHLSKIKNLPKGKYIYCGFAHIPFIVSLGHMLRNVSLDIIDIDHSTKEYRYSWEESNNKNTKIKKLIPENLNFEAEDIALKICFSSSIDNQNIISRLGEIDIASLELNKIERRTFSSKFELDQFIINTSEIINTLKNQLRFLKRVHLFIAAPPPVALRIGALISETHDPEFIAYNYTSRGGYGWGVSIQSQEFISK